LNMIVFFYGCLSESSLLWMILYQPVTRIVPLKVKQ
jgi:hypothetical protein